MKFVKLLLVLILVMWCTPILRAIPIINTPNDGTEDRSGGGVYDYYQNSGMFIGYHSGNNNNLTYVQGLLQGWLGMPTLILTTTSNVKIVSSSTGLSGTWYTEPPSGQETIDFYIIKASNGFAAYKVDPAEATGSWSTFDIWTNNTSGNSPGHEISHFTGYNPTIITPEPGILVLCGLGLVGLIGISNKKKD